MAGNLSHFKNQDCMFFLCFLSSFYLWTWIKCVFTLFSKDVQWSVWAVLLWPSLLIVCIPLDCKDEQGSLSRCPSITQEKLLDRVIQHAELIYRVSEESCTLFVSNIHQYPQNETLHLCRNVSADLLLYLQTLKECF